MSHDIDHDSQRELEQRALRNVRWLAEKLGYQDAIDRRAERGIVIGLGTGLVAIVVVLVLLAMNKGNAEEDKLALQRCETAARADAIAEVRQQLAREHPEMDQSQRDTMIDGKRVAAATAQCAVPAVI